MKHANIGEPRGEAAVSTSPASLLIRGLAPRPPILIDSQPCQFGLNTAPALGTEAQLATQLVGKACGKLQTH